MQNAETSQKFIRLLESRLLCSNTAGRKEMSKAFNFVTVQKEHTVDSIKVSCRNILLSFVENNRLQMGIDFRGHSVLGTL